MRSSDDTFYNLKRLHVVFAASALALLAATVWMVVADHRREWKVYQRIYRDQVEPWLTAAQRLEERTAGTSAAADEKSRAAVEQFDRTIGEEGPNFGQRLLRLPLIDAFGRPLAIDQIWLPNLTIDYNFRPVARFDRCTTCHQGMAAASTDLPVQPACLSERVLTVSLAAPLPSQASQKAQRDLLNHFGMTFAPRGILDAQAATIGVVLPRTAAANACVYPGDHIQQINGAMISGREQAVRVLMDETAWGKPLELQIRRGLPQPFSWHPQPDLFLSTHSPHPVEQFGCTICHRGQGSATEFPWASHTPNDPHQRQNWRSEHGWSWNQHWDFPMLAKRFAQSSCLQCHHDPNELAESERFLDPPAAKLLAGYDLVRQYGCFGCHETKGIGPSGERLGPDMRLEASRAEAAEALGPGTLRKVGPSLRHVAGKLEARFIDRWIADPAALRPTTRMPRLYGLDEHLARDGLVDARRFEAVELQAIAHYLLAASQPAPPVPTPAGVTEPPSAERGKRLFVMRGCAACHQHEDVPMARSTAGPDLSRLGTKLTTEAGAKWLVEWIRDPSQHSPRTLMPNAMLEPELLSSAEGEQPGQKPRMTDPAADIASYLLGRTAESSTPLAPREVPAIADKDLDELALLYLTKTYPRKQAEEYLANGIPPSMAGEVAGEAADLVGPLTSDKKIRYVGRRTIARRGCFGCHDIPGFEDAQPIGPALSDWGRKQESLLAFEQVQEFLAKSEQPGQRRAGQGGALQEDLTETEADHEFFTEAVSAGRREGFLWQKLRAPRSFDYKKADTKPYNEQLTMGRFNFSAAEREAIITFVLGLVAQPPRDEYLPKLNARRRAIVEGRGLINQYGCAECHTFRMERWSLQVDPEKFESPAHVSTYDFVLPWLAAEQLAASQKANRRGLVHADVVGEPIVDSSGEVIQDEDDDGNPLYAFNLWEPAAINAQVWRVGAMQVPVSSPNIAAKRPAWGGAYARLLYPLAVEAAGTAGTEAWGWVPPPLMHEGRKVRPAWLYDYLLQPALIRPAAVLRMPRFNLSPAEARKLADYFAAVDGVEFPYAPPPAPADMDDQRREAALRLLTDRTTFCAKCHLIGDFSPGGETGTILGPNLENVAGRLRPEYLRRWLADPKSELPYTGMPVNFPPDGPAMGQDFLPGNGAEQLDAVMDLLLHYEVYLRRRTSIRGMMEAEKKSDPMRAGGAKGGTP